MYVCPLLVWNVVCDVTVYLLVGQRLHDLSCVPQIPVWSAARFNWGSIDVSALLAYAGILLIVSQSLGVWLLIPRYGEYRVLLVALCAGAVQMVLFGLSYKPWMMYGTVTVTVPWFLATPCVRGLLAKSVPRHEQGRLQGTDGVTETRTVSQSSPTRPLPLGCGVDMGVASQQCLATCLSIGVCVITGGLSSLNTLCQAVSPFVGKT